MVEKKSTHRVEVVRVEKVDKHPNADSLSIVHVWGYACVVRTSEFPVGSLAAYIVPDSIVPLDRPEFAFLKDPKRPDKKAERIRVRRFRGALSQGLLLQAPPGSKEGDDVSDILGVTRYEPPLETTTGGELENPPEGLLVPKYDVEDIHRYPAKFIDGEEILITEKVHGSNSCFVWYQDRMWVRARHDWRKDDPKSLWWLGSRSCPEIETWCRAHPGVVVFGECYGKVQNLKYGLENEIKVAVFDIWDHSRFLDVDEARSVGAGLPWVPTVHRGPYSFGKVVELSAGPSLVPGAKHMQEGVVVLPVRERTDLELGRVQLKCVSDEYLEKEKY